jgi:hypothetical protein
MRSLKNMYGDESGGSRSGFTLLKRNGDQSDILLIDIVDQDLIEIAMNRTETFAHKRFVNLPRGGILRKIGRM